MLLGLVGVSGNSSQGWLTEWDLGDLGRWVVDTGRQRTSAASGGPSGSWWLEIWVPRKTSPGCEGALRRGLDCSDWATGASGALRLV